MQSLQIAQRARRVNQHLLETPAESITARWSTVPGAQTVDTFNDTKQVRLLCSLRRDGSVFRAVAPLLGKRCQTEPWWPTVRCSVQEQCPRAAVEAVDSALRQFASRRLCKHEEPAQGVGAARGFLACQLSAVGRCGPARIMQLLLLQRLLWCPAGRVFHGKSSYMPVILLTAFDSSRACSASQKLCWAVHLADSRSFCHRTCDLVQLQRATQLVRSSVCLKGDERSDML